MTKHWPNDSLPRSKESSASRPRHLPSQTLKMPSTKDMPKQKNGRVGTKGVQGSGVKRDNRNSIGHGVRVGSRVRVGNGVKVKNGVRVANEVRARSGPRAMGMMRVERAASMRCGNPGSGRPSVKKRGPASPPAAPHNGMGSVPSSWRPQVNG